MLSPWSHCRMTGPIFKTHTLPVLCVAGTTHALPTWWHWVHITSHGSNLKSRLMNTRHKAGHFTQWTLDFLTAGHIHLKNACFGQTPTLDLLNISQCAAHWVPSPHGTDTAYAILSDTCMQPCPGRNQTSDSVPQITLSHIETICSTSKPHQHGHSPLTKHIVSWP